MIRFAFDAPAVTGPHVGAEFHVVHPSNGAIIAYCSTLDEADEVSKAIVRVILYLSTPKEKP